MRAGRELWIGCAFGVLLTIAFGLAIWSGFTGNEIGLYIAGAIIVALILWLWFSPDKPDDDLYE